MESIFIRSPIDNATKNFGWFLKLSMLWFGRFQRGDFCEEASITFHRIPAVSFQTDCNRADYSLLQILSFLPTFEKMSITLKIGPRFVNQDQDGFRPFQAETLQAIGDPSVRLGKVEAPIGAGKSHTIKRLIDSPLCKKWHIMTLLMLFTYKTICIRVFINNTIKFYRIN